MKKITRAIRSCRLFRPMTFEEAKRLCLDLSKAMVREHERTMKAALDHDDDRSVALHLLRMTKYARKFRLSRASLLLNFRLLVGNTQEREAIIAGCFDASFELMLKPESGNDTEPSSSKKPPTD